MSKKFKGQYMEMGYRIKVRRKEIGMTQEQLAERICVSNNHISAIETARDKPGMDTFLRLCEYLKTTPDYLLLGTIHVNNIPQNIVDSLRLCSEEDLWLVQKFIEILIERNEKNRLVE
jgi:transcriptional regulator with XRE-family HTH domain